MVELEVYPARERRLSPLLASGSCPIGPSSRTRAFHWQVREGSRGDIVLQSAGMRAIGYMQVYVCIRDVFFMHAIFGSPFGCLYSATSAGQPTVRQTGANSARKHVQANLAPSTTIFDPNGTATDKAPDHYAAVGPVPEIMRHEGQQTRQENTARQANTSPEGRDESGKE